MLNIIVAVGYIFFTFPDEEPEAIFSWNTEEALFSAKHVPQFIVEVVILVAQNKIKIQMPAKSRNESSGCQKYTKYTASQSLSQYEAAA